MNLKVIVPSLIVLSAIGAGAWYYLSLDSDHSVTPLGDTIKVPEIVETPEVYQPIKRTPIVVDDEPIEEDPVAEAPVEQELPPLDKLPSSLADSDIGLIQAAKSLAPKLVVWMTPDQQVRKWVFLIDRVAEGDFPIQNRPLSYDVDKFQVESTEHEEVFYLSEKNFQRAEQLISVITQIPAEDIVRYYQHWLPLFNDAYAELGREDSFQDRLLQAIDNILAIESLNGKVELKQPSVFYVYADKNLEQVDKLNKFFWRLGPTNTKKVQSYLKNLEPLIN